MIMPSNFIGLESYYMTTPLAILAPNHQQQLQKFESHLLSHQANIESWLRQQWRATPPPIYSSMDLRNAGYKMAPVDTNLFPAGFNNLNREFIPLYIQTVQSFLEQLNPGCRRIVIVPESHTRNIKYFENLQTLQEILLKAGYEVRIGSLLEEITKPTTIDLPSNRSIVLEPLIRQNNKVGVEGFCACTVLLNNDLSAGIPKILQDLDQTVLPPLQMGWHNRRKSVHFKEYEEVAKEFSEVIGIDPWLINPIFRVCSEVDFLKREGETILQDAVSDVIAQVQRKYLEYDIKEKPFVVIKADSGTYGMGVMTVSDPAELTQLNRKDRNKMSTAKGQQKITQVIVQEGVYSFETMLSNNAVAEPVVYLFGQYVLGGFYRIHTERSNIENLNAPGAYFEPIAFSGTCNNPQHNCSDDLHLNLYYSYGVVARLAAVAAAREIHHLPD